VPPFRLNEGLLLARHELFIHAQQRRVVCVVEQPTDLSGFPGGPSGERVPLSRRLARNLELAGAGK
jgi:hypothetical protein